MYFLIGTSALSGCATGNHYTEPSSLTPASEQKMVYLDKEYNFKWTLNTGNVTFSLAPGQYIAELIGQGGTFYRGPANAVREVNRRPGQKTISWQHEGGVFVPTADASAAKLYYYVDSRDPETLLDTAIQIAIPPTATPRQALSGGVGAGIGGAIVAAVITQDNGKIFFPPDQPEDSQLRNWIRF